MPANTGTQTFNENNAEARARANQRGSVSPAQQPSQSVNAHSAPNSDYILPHEIDKIQEDLKKEIEKLENPHKQWSEDETYLLLKHMFKHRTDIEIFEPLEIGYGKYSLHNAEMYEQSNVKKTLLEYIIKAKSSKLQSTDLYKRCVLPFIAKGKNNRSILQIAILDFWPRGNEIDHPFIDLTFINPLTRPNFKKFGMKTEEELPALMEMLVKNNLKSIKPRYFSEEFKGYANVNPENSYVWAIVTTLFFITTKSAPYVETYARVESHEEKFSLFDIQATEAWFKLILEDLSTSSQKALTVAQPKNNLSGVTLKSSQAKILAQQENISHETPFVANYKDHNQTAIHTAESNNPTFLKWLLGGSGKVFLAEDGETIFLEKTDKVTVERDTDDNIVKVFKAKKGQVLTGKDYIAYYLKTIIDYDPSLKNSNQRVHLEDNIPFNNYARLNRIFLFKLYSTLEFAIVTFVRLYTFENENDINFFEAFDSAAQIELFANLQKLLTNLIKNVEDSVINEFLHVSEEIDLKSIDDWNKLASGSNKDDRIKEFNYGFGANLHNALKQKLQTFLKPFSEEAMKTIKYFCTGEEAFSQRYFEITTKMGSQMLNARQNLSSKDEIDPVTFKTSLIRVDKRLEKNRQEHIVKLKEKLQTMATTEKPEKLSSKSKELPACYKYEPSIIHPQNSYLFHLMTALSFGTVQIDGPKDKNDNNLLHKALQQGAFNSASTLVNYGINVMAVNKKGKTPGEMRNFASDGQMLNTFKNLPKDASELCKKVHAKIAERRLLIDGKGYKTKGLWFTQAFYTESNRALERRLLDVIEAEVNLTMRNDEDSLFTNFLSRMKKSCTKNNKYIFTGDNLRTKQQSIYKMYESSERLKEIRKAEQAQDPVVVVNQGNTIDPCVDQSYSKLRVAFFAMFEEIVAEVIKNGQIRHASDPIITAAMAVNEESLDRIVELEDENAVLKTENQDLRTANENLTLEIDSQQRIEYTEDHSSFGSVIQKKGTNTTSSATSSTAPGVDNTDGVKPPELK